MYPVACPGTSSATCATPHVAQTVCIWCRFVESVQSRNFSEQTLPSGLCLFCVFLYVMNHV